MAAATATATAAATTTAAYNNSNNNDSVSFLVFPPPLPTSPLRHSGASPHLPHLPRRYLQFRSLTADSPLPSVTIDPSPPLLP